MENKTAKAISELVNKISFNGIEIGTELSTDHRYLQNELFKMFIHFAGNLAANYKNGKYDGRNEYACKCAKIMIDALERNELFDAEYYLEEYEKIKAQIWQ